MKRFRLLLVLSIAAVLTAVAAFALIPISLPDDRSVALTVASQQPGGAPDTRESPRGVTPRSTFWQEVESALRRTYNLSCVARLNRISLGLLVAVLLMLISLAASTDGAPEGAVEGDHDITDLRRSDIKSRRRQQDEEHAERITALGVLAASLAHELRQPLTAVLVNAQAAQRFLAMDPPNIEEVGQILADISENDKRAVEILSRIRTLMEREATELQPLDVNTVVRDAVQLVNADLVRQNATATLELEPELPSVLGDAVQLQQALLNLIHNSLEAMGPDTRDPRVAIRTYRPNASTIEVAVQDNGVGIPPDRLTQLFKPFQTTKQGGMGIGLWITRSFIESHGGRLWVANNPDRGATFRFSLPTMEETTQ
jgi:C4-dicarboxylate-specific signal transduction histidine kinase